MKPDTAICYSDGSASPNPGLCGAGVSIFYCEPDTVLDCGVSLGRGTNNFAELYGLGIIFTRLLELCLARPIIKRAVIFCDSKLALRAATSIKNPISNGPIVRAVRAAFVAVASKVELDLQWIRGHVQFGGNERVDRISKAFAQVVNNDFAFTLQARFPAGIRTRKWDPGFPLNALPTGVFLLDLPAPGRGMDVPTFALDASSEGFVDTNIGANIDSQCFRDFARTLRSLIAHSPTLPQSISAKPVGLVDDAPSN